MTHDLIQLLFALAGVVFTLTSLATRAYAREREVTDEHAGTSLLNQALLYIIMALLCFQIASH